MIYALDGLAFTNPGDVLNHFDQTTVDYIDGSTKIPTRATAMLPRHGSHRGRQ